MRNQRMGINIVRVKTSDFQRLYEVWTTSCLSVGDSTTERNEFLSMLEMNPDSCLMAIANGTIVGSVFGIWNGRRAWIYHLAVLPAWQGTGIGSSLLMAAETALSARGAGKVCLWVNVDNLRVVPFYEKHGYRAISDAIMLGKDLVKGGDTHE